jgi:hypothetical protein
MMTVIRFQRSCRQFSLLHRSNVARGDVDALVPHCFIDQRLACFGVSTFPPGIRPTASMSMRRGFGCQTQDTCRRKLVPVERSRRIIALPVSLLVSCASYRRQIVTLSRIHRPPHLILPDQALGILLPFDSPSIFLNSAGLLFGELADPAGASGNNPEFRSLNQPDVR